MSRKRTLGTMAAIGGFTAAIAVMTGVPVAKADEVSDLRANNELLQQKLDQIAQTQPAGPTRIGSTDIQTITAQAMAGSFPRSFLIPGTDTSIRIGGQITEVLDYSFEGANTNSSPQTTTVGDNGTALSTPLEGTLARSRSSNVFSQSPRESKISFETRTPTAYGEARTYMEFDWAGSTVYAPGGGNPTSVSDNLHPRLRYAYGTLGGWLVGQANSNFSDSDANAETLDFGGNVGDPGVVRIPQVRYTMPLMWSWGGALSFSAETPETDVQTPLGLIASDCGVPCAATATGPGVAAGMPNPTKAGAPDLTAALYIPQPWGHIDLSAVLRPDMVLSDGKFFDRSFMGFGGHLGISYKPGWWTPKDTLNFQFTAGDGIGRYLNASSNFAIATNFVATAATPAAAAALKAKTVGELGFEGGYQHWWMDNLRSNISYGQNQVYVPDGIVGGGANRLVQTMHANIIWNPVSFVDVGLEFLWARREIAGVPKTAPNEGQEQVVISKIAVRF